MRQEISSRAYSNGSLLAAAAAAGPMDVDELAACFSGRGPWKKRLPQLVEMLVAVGRARRVGGEKVIAL
jgi:hypothetical protein